MSFKKLFEPFEHQFARASGVSFTAGAAHDLTEEPTEKAFFAGLERLDLFRRVGDDRIDDGDQLAVVRDGAQAFGLDNLRG